MAAVVPHTLRTADASAQNNQPSTLARKGGKKKPTNFFFCQYVSGTAYDRGDVRWQPTATPLRGHHGVPNERECRVGDARSPCRRLAHPSGPCPSNRARRQTARGRERLRPCASRTVSASSTCGERGYCRLGQGRGDETGGMEGGLGEGEEEGGEREGEREGGRGKISAVSLGHGRH